MRISCRLLPTFHQLVLAHLLEPWHPTSGQRHGA
ncbi:mCG147593 [Mus musculus]|nr:mCG147593 [Mus musculus]